jgi:hypothetical protein
VRRAHDDDVNLNAQVAPLGWIAPFPGGLRRVPSCSSSSDFRRYERNYQTTATFLLTPSSLLPPGRPPGSLNPTDRGRGRGEEDDDDDDEDEREDEDEDEDEHEYEHGEWGLPC